METDTGVDKEKFILDSLVHKNLHLFSLYLLLHAVWLGTDCTKRASLLNESGESNEMEAIGKSSRSM